MRSVEWSVASKKDLIEIYEYIFQDSCVMAKKVIEEIVTSTRYLNEFSYLGKKVYETKNDNYREIIVSRYRVIYRVEEKKVKIMTIIHTSKNFKK